MSKQILKIGGSLVSGGLLGQLPAAGAQAVTALKSKAKASAPAAPLVMPLPDDAAAQAARRRSIAEQRQRAGRASTILTDTSQKLGG
jgi:hypothetical protein